MTHTDHHDRIVLVTGGAHGIGLGIVNAFAAAGADVVIADLQGEESAEAAATIAAGTGRDAIALTVDVRDAKAVEATVGRAIDHFGRIDVLVNNAGIYPNTPVIEMDEAEWDSVFDINVKGMFLMSRAVARAMIAHGQGGRIVNISSGAAESGRVGAAHYCSSKAAVNMFTRVLALELAPHRIVVNAVGPGLIEVPNARLSSQYVEEVLAATPLGRIGHPEDVAQAVLYLASPAATYITGTTLYVDGGGLAGRPLPPSG